MLIAEYKFRLGLGERETIMASDIISHLKNKKILILGFGREGQSSYDFIDKHFDEIQPEKVIIADLNPIDSIEFYNEERIEIVHGDNYLDAMGNADIVLKSPGINFNMFHKKIVNGHYELEEYPGVEISGQMDLFLRYTDAKVIGVAGTKGKSTTTSLVYEVIKSCTEKFFLLGNIGIPVLDYFDEVEQDSYCAIEMGVHQLEFCMAAPHVAIVTNLYPEHLDHYRGLDDYANSKLNILRWQKDDDIAILAAHEEMLIDRALPLVRGKLLLVNDVEKQSFIDEQELDELGIKLLGRYSLTELGRLRISKTETEQSEELDLHLNPHLLGRHNKNNIIMAVAACAIYGIDEHEAVKAIENFAGLEHRLEFVGNFRGVSFYNDSIATIPAATKLAIEALNDIGKVTTLLLGGLNRDLNYSNLVDFLYETDLRTVICFPDTGYDIANLIKEKNKSMDKQIIAVVIEDMAEAVRFAYEITRQNEICLLSPAAASYNKYKNFAARGTAYKESIQKFADAKI